MKSDSECTFNPGEVAPVVNRERCETKGPCVAVCPYGVFVIEGVTEDDRRSLSLVGRLKLWAHGGQQAYPVFAERCQGCGLCVAACPEEALSLQKIDRM